MDISQVVKSRNLYFTGPRKVEVREEALDELGPGDVLIKALASAISAGTEMNVYRGVAPQWRKHQDPNTRLFIDTGMPEWQYPSRYGYASVGHVVQVGGNVSNPRIGNLVFSYSPHGEYVVAASERVVVLDGLRHPEHGIFFANVNTAYNGILDAHPALGAVVVVMGLGVIGQLVTQLLARSGPSQLIVVDLIEARRALAQKSGATHVLDPSQTHIAEAVRDLTNGRGADIVIEVSGSPQALNEAIRTVGYNGLVIAMSWYGGTFETLSLAGEFHHNRPRIVSSQVGGVNPYLSPMWTLSRRADQARNYLTTLDFSHLISHRIPLSEAPTAYDLLDKNPEQALQVVFQYEGGPA